jgi:hypothetical protein
MVNAKKVMRTRRGTPERILDAIAKIIQRLDGVTTADVAEMASANGLFLGTCKEKRNPGSSPG